MSSPDPSAASVLCFGPFRLLPIERRLERDGTVVPLGSRALDILIALAERPGEVLGRDALMRRAWPDLTVDDSNLRFHVAGLRKALEDGTGEQRYIVNVPGRGYCLAATIRTEAIATPPRSRPEASGLPPILERMVGRDQAVEAVAALVTRHRFATILGAGGMGKTTVAIAAAYRLLQSGQDEVRFLDLGPLADPTLVASALASALGVAAQSGDPTPEVIGNLRDRKILLVFDGCEHLVAGVAALAETIYMEAPGASLLVTSRERLKVEGEHVFILSELEQPPFAEGLTPAEVLGFPAAHLLAERAAAAGQTADLTPADATLMAEICRTLDGVPLALELVAGRVADYGWAQTAALLHGRLRLLWTGRRTAPPRHQTLRSAVEWSYDLLPPTERKVFEQLSIFSGPFDLRDALAVATADGLTAVDITGAVQSLVEKSLVAVRSDGVPAAYRLLDTTRAFGREKLEEAGIRQAVASRHAAHVLASLEPPDVLAPPDVTGVPARPALGDINAALQWSFAESGDPQLATRLAAAAARPLIELSLLNECRRWSEAALALGPTDDETVMRLNEGLGYAVMFTQGNGAEAGAALERALALANDLADIASQFRLMVTLLRFRRGRGEYSLLMPMSRRLEALAASIGDPFAISCAHYQVGTALHLLGEQQAARSHLEAEIQLDVFDDVPPHHYAYSSHPFIPMSRCLWLLGYPDQALTMARHIAGGRAATDAVSHCVALMWITTVFEATGEWDVVGQLAERLVAYARSHSMRPYQAVGLGHQGRRLLELGQAKAAVALLRNAIGQARQHGMIMPGFEGSLALALIGAGETDEAHAVVGEAIRRIRSDGESHELPELLRIMGEVQLRRNAHSDAVVTFDEGMAIAHRQGALSWKLRLAMSRYRAGAELGEASLSRAILADVFGQFSEGFETADLLSARRLLDRTPGGA